MPEESSAPRWMGCGARGRLWSNSPAPSLSDASVWIDFHPFETQQKEEFAMKCLLTCLTLVIAATGSPAAGQQIPVKRPADWQISLRFYGTTDMPGKDTHRISVSSNGKLAPRISSVKPQYDDQGKMILDKSPQHREPLSEEACNAIYQATRAVILNQQIGVAPPQTIRDGESVEISLRSFDRELSAVFHHNSARDSQEFAELIKVINRELPNSFQPVASRGP